MHCSAYALFGILKVEVFLLVGSNLYFKVGYVCYIKEIAEVCEYELIYVNLTSMLSYLRCVRMSVHKEQNALLTW